jgi:3-hydroxyisobutyrate dehydrogenase-like beta-hydroxyacid dehydrogenase
MTGTSLHVGFIGLGSQGGPMAEQIAAHDFPLTVWARRPEALAPFAEKGATVADSPEALAVACDHIGLCVVNDRDVAEICDRLIPTMRSGSLLAIHSTILPESCVELAARCAGRGIAFIDAPVSGGGPAATAKTLSVMCGGTPEAFAQAMPVLETFAGLCLLLGEVGSGQRAKLVNNALLAATMGLAHAALGAADTLGLDRAALIGIIKVSTGRSMGFDIYARLPSPAAFQIGAPLLRKDVDLLKSVLPDDPGAEALRVAADPFLDAALGD